MSRDTSLDAVKGFLILLVVFGHLIEPLRGQTWVMHSYKFIYSFHMPAFIFLCGLFTKKKYDDIDWKNIINRILIPLIIFEMIYVALHFQLKGTLPNQIKNMSGYWILWFLVSLFFWRALTPLLLSFRWPFIISIVIALIAQSAWNTGSYLSSGRTFTFLPFFVLGLTHGEFLIKKIRSHCTAWVWLFLSLIALVIVYKISYYPSRFVFFGSKSFHSLGLSVLQGIPLRIGIYILSFISIASILIIIRPWPLLSHWGQRSLEIYLWHGVIIMIMRQYLDWGMLRSNSAISFLGLFLVSVILCMALSSNLILNATKKITRAPAKITAS